ncbi:MAG: tyrosine-type recombinase/integrase [Agathobacter sp.]|nr:tyrosine-type recombinase/integrase [Agathobacter sp.]
MPRGRKIIKTVEIEERTIRDAAEEFFENNRVKGLAKATQKGYQDYVNAFIKWVGEETILSDITLRTMDKYMLYCEDRGNKAVSVATIMVHLRRFFKFCNSRGYMEQLEITIPKFETELKEPYSDEEMKLLLEKPKSDNWVELRNWCMINYFFATGQRLSTVLNIKVKDLDLLSAKVKLVWNKDKIQKYMPLSSAIIKILQEYISISALHDEDYLFPEYEGKKLRVRSAEDSIAEYNRKRGVEKTSIHLFRHTFAKNYIIAGGNPVKLQHLLNHKTIDMTMKYVNLYGTDIAADLDMFNPLDNFKRKNYTPTKRKIVNYSA